VSSNIAEVRVESEVRGILRVGQSDPSFLLAHAPLVRGAHGSTPSPHLREGAAVDSDLPRSSSQGQKGKNSSLRMDVAPSHRVQDPHILLGLQLCGLLCIQIGCCVSPSHSWGAQEQKRPSSDRLYCPTQSR
jgi:hypothetical protein